MLAAQVRGEAGVEIAGYRHVVDEDHIRHVRELRGPQGRADQSVPDSVWALLPQVVGEPDAVEWVRPNPADPADRGGLNFRKRVAGTVWLVATRIRTKRGQLALSTVKRA